MTEAETSDNELLREIQILSQELNRIREAEQEVARRNQDLVALTAISAAMNQSLELQEVVDIALEETLAVLNIEGGLICLFDSATDTFVPASYRGVSDRIVEALTGFKIGDGLTGSVGKSNEPLIVADLSESTEHSFPEAEGEGMPFYAGVPISGGSGLLGVMVLLASQPRNFSADRLGLLGDIGEQVGRALANARLYRQTKQEIVERMVSERQRAKLMEQLQAQVRQQNQIMDAVPAALLLIDGSHRIELANEVAEEEMAELIGAEEGETLNAVGGTPLGELLTQPPQGQWHDIEADDRRYRVAARCLAEEEESQEGAGWVLVIQDVTDDRQPVEDSIVDRQPVEDASDERREVQESRRHDQTDALGQLAAGISSHLDSALDVIGLYVAMSLRTADPPTKLHERLQVIDKEIRRAGGLIRKVAHYGQRAVLSCRPMDLLETCRELTEELERTAPKSLSVELVHGSEDYTVDGDVTHLRQSLKNLLDNSREAMPNGGELRVALQRLDRRASEDARLPSTEVGEWVQVTVTDTGGGVRPEDLPKVFDPFFTTKESDTASGMGLSQSYGIVRQHGGQLYAWSTVGKGTTFAVHLPAVVADRPPERKAQVASAKGKGKGKGQTVLVVVQDRALRGALVDALGDLGYQVLGAGDGRAALTVFEQYKGKVAAVLMEAEASEVAQTRLQALRRRNPKLKAVMISALAIDEDEVRKQGWDGWLLKPPELTRLEEVVAEILGD